MTSREVLRLVTTGNMLDVKNTIYTIYIHLRQ